ncbi:MAG: hypothetical protein Q8R72_14860 [Hylemonella sp.]|nr:hypothetical protein [Hylemonella sp.]
MHTASPSTAASVLQGRIPALSSLAAFVEEERLKTTERLPFSVRIVRSGEDLERAIALRYEAYARHMPEFAQKLRQAEPDDFEADSIILLAESRIDGSVIGTMRIQNNSYRPLSMEHSISLPDVYKGQSMVEVRRLGVAKGASGRLVKMVLIKACLLYCEKNNIQWAMVAARPPLDQSYEKLMFIDVMPGKTFTPLPTANNVPHRVMAFQIDGYEGRLIEAKHQLHGFFCGTHHPDIDVNAASSFNFPREYDRRQQRAEQAFT